MLYTKRKRSRISGVFEIRAVAPREDGARTEVRRFESGAAHRSMPGEQPRVLCLVIHTALEAENEA